MSTSGRDFDFQRGRLSAFEQAAATIEATANQSFREGDSDLLILMRAFLNNLARDMRRQAAEAHSMTTDNACSKSIML